MGQKLKASAGTCRGCGTDIPEQPSRPGRPREFCTRRCRRDFHHREEQARIEAERHAEQEARVFEYEQRLYGIREARRQAKWRAEARKRERRSNH